MPSPFCFGKPACSELFFSNQKKGRLISQAPFPIHAIGPIA